MKVELLSFPGCSTAGPTRDALLEAMRRVGVALAIEEVDTTAPSAPTYARGWPSPTVLIDGADLEGLAHQPDGASCRLYEGRGVPSLELLERRLRGRSASASRSWSVRGQPAGRAARRGAGAIGIGALVAALAASVCCIGPLLFAILGVTGMGFLAHLERWRPVLLAITAVLVTSGLWFSFRAASAAAYPWLSARITSITRLAGGRSSSTRGAEIAIKEITCASCAETITGRLVVVPGVDEASVDLDRDIVIVRYDPMTTNPAALVAVVSSIPSYSAELLRGDLP